MAGLGHGWRHRRLVVLWVRADEKSLVVHLLRLVRSKGWLSAYVRRMLADFAAGRTPSPLSAVIDARRMEALGSGGDG